MSSLDSRIEREEKLHKQEVEAANNRRLERLRAFLGDEALNAFRRCLNSGVTREDAADWLHNKLYDQSYDDWGAQAKRPRTRRRIELLLQLCDGDKKLLLREFDRAIRRYFVIKSAAYDWKLRFKLASDGRLTIVFGWRRVDPPVGTQSQQPTATS